MVQLQRPVSGAILYLQRPVSGAILSVAPLSGQRTRCTTIAPHLHHHFHFQEVVNELWCNSRDRSLELYYISRDRSLELYYLLHHFPVNELVAQLLHHTCIITFIFKKWSMNYGATPETGLWSYTISPETGLWSYTICCITFRSTNSLHNYCTTLASSLS